MNFIFELRVLMVAMLAATAGTDLPNSIQDKTTMAEHNSSCNHFGDNNRLL
jgi:hypothetical protein